MVRDLNMSQLMKQQLRQTMSRLESVSTAGCSTLVNHDRKFWLLLEKWEMSHKVKSNRGEREEFYCTTKNNEKLLKSDLLSWLLKSWSLLTAVLVIFLSHFTDPADKHSLLFTVFACVYFWPLGDTVALSKAGTNTVASG